jgi:ribonuclease HI
MNPIKGITINTDASFYQEHKTGGYAFWIVCDLFKIQKGGFFKAEVANCTDAEMKAIGNAIATLLAQKELPQANFLIINTDSKVAIEQIRHQSTPLGKEVFKLWQRLINRLKTNRNEFRWVKAHSGKDDARSFVNEWCDKEAKKWAKISIQNKNKS